jgi:hypothetical protein
MSKIKGHKIYDLDAQSECCATVFPMFSRYLTWSHKYQRLRAERNMLVAFGSIAMDQCE